MWNSTGGGHMKRYRVVTMLIVGVVAAAVCSPLAAQQGEEVLQARAVVVRELVTSLPGTLPDGAMAVLPPKVEDPGLVDARAVATWPTAVEEAIHTLRPGLTVVDRTHLTEILREQKFGDSAYADPKTAAEVGKLVSARMLLLTRIHELRLVEGKVRVSLEASLVDVETGENLWSRSIQRGIFPVWARVLIGLFLAVVILALIKVGTARWRRRLVREKVPRAKGALSVDVAGVVRAATAARERLQRAGAVEGAEAVHRAWNELDPVLDRVRHALPGGAVDRSRIRDLRGALGVARHIAQVLAELRAACDAVSVGDEGGRRLAGEMDQAATELGEALDRYRRFMV